MCAKHGIQCVEKTLQKHDLYIADEFFLTGSGAEVIPVTKLDGRPIGPGTPGPVTRKLIEAFHALVRA
jgi:branched-chain amino acid aminotransferase